MTFWLLLNIQTINLLYALSGLWLLGFTSFLLYDYFWGKQVFYRNVLAPYVWWVIMAASIGAVATTLLYSEVFGFVPCSLCWLQRVALYPQALLAIVAFRLKDTLYYPTYGISLSVFGFAVAVYQYIYQMVPPEARQTGLLPCLADGSADCATKIMEVFGFVTFPFLSAVLFAFLATLYLHIRKANTMMSNE